mgnify:CR=1 FL=1
MAGDHAYSVVNFNKNWRPIVSATANTIPSRVIMFGLISYGVFNHKYRVAREERENRRDDSLIELKNRAGLLTAEQYAYHQSVIEKRQ